jgi:hypothetical protein
MAERPKGYGMTAELQQKKEEAWKGIQKDAKDAVKWIEDIVGEKFPSDYSESVDKVAFHEWLKDGKILCKLINKLQPDSAKVNKLNAAFQMVSSMKLALYIKHLLSLVGWTNNCSMALICQL